MPTGQQSNWQLLALSTTLSNWLSSAACTGHIGTQCDESGAGTGTRAQAVRLSRQLKRQLNKLCVCIGPFSVLFFYYICQRRANFEPVINKAELALAMQTKRGVTCVCVCVGARVCLSYGEICMPCTLQIRRAATENCISHTLQSNIQLQNDMQSSAN